MTSLVQLVLFQMFSKVCSSGRVRGYRVPPTCYLHIHNHHSFQNDLVLYTSGGRGVWSSSPVQVHCSVTLNSNES